MPDSLDAQRVAAFSTTITGESVAVYLPLGFES